MNIPPLKFILQDSAQPIPNLDTKLLTGNFAELMSAIAVEPLDFVNVNMSSSVTGGSYNLSFEVGANATALQILIPSSFVVANSGKTVRLLLRIRRTGMIYSAPDATVFIDGSVIVVPTPGTKWDFDDGTLQGWVPQGTYIGGVVKVINQRVVVDLPNSTSIKSHIITRSVPVIAGRTYRCSYQATTDLPAADGSRLHMTINGVSIGGTSAVIPNFILLGDGTFTAQSTGIVHLGIFNEKPSTGPHRLFVDNIEMTEQP